MIWSGVSLSRNSFDRASACLIDQEEAATREAGHSAGRQPEKIPAAQTIAVKGRSKLRAHVRSPLQSNDWNDIIVRYRRLLEGIKERRTQYILRIVNVLKGSSVSCCQKCGAIPSPDQ